MTPASTPGRKPETTDKIETQLEYLTEPGGIQLVDKDNQLFNEDNAPQYVLLYRMAGDEARYGIKFTW